MYIKLSQKVYQHTDSKYSWQQKLDLSEIVIVDLISSQKCLSLDRTIIIQLKLIRNSFFFLLYLSVV
jgi:hypothetical protein